MKHFDENVLQMFPRRFLETFWQNVSRKRLGNICKTFSSKCFIKTFYKHFLEFTNICIIEFLSKCFLNLHKRFQDVLKTYFCLLGRPLLGNQGTQLILMLACIHSMVECSTRALISILISKIQLYIHIVATNNLYRSITWCYGFLVFEILLNHKHSQREKHIYTNPC